MRIRGKPYRTIWVKDGYPCIIDQRVLPFRVVEQEIRTSAEMVRAIKEMRVRGAPLIGVAAAFGAYLAAREVGGSAALVSSKELMRYEALLLTLLEARPTAVNLRWALERQKALVREGESWSEVITRQLQLAQELAEQDVQTCRAIGEFGYAILRKIVASKGAGNSVEVLTHCNAGWLATIDYGTATAPIYLAHESQVPLHVWVDETRPRLQGSRLTAFELAEEGIPHSIIVDNAGGLLMQQGRVDVCIVGTDRVTRAGHVANKIGTYLKALAAKHNRVPFYVACPSSSIDWGVREISEVPIEYRGENEVLYAEGQTATGELVEVRIAAEQSDACNPGFDVTPNELISGLITERGVCEASEEGLLSLFPERRGDAAV